jgi:ABC transporter substrate binding protein
VFAAAEDPLGTELVASLAQPGGNVTGLSTQLADAAGKKLELLREAVPGLRSLAIIGNVGYPGSVLEMNEVQAAARTVGLKVATLEIRRAEDVAPAFEALKDPVEALYICGDPLTATNRNRILTFALAARLPTMSPNREQLEHGGFISYGPNWPDLYRRAAEIVDKILRGAKPTELPVEQPTKFDLVVNLVTARALGLTVPPTLLARADESNAGEGLVTMKLPHRRRFLQLAAGAAALPAVLPVAWAQAYPSRPVRWIVALLPAARPISWRALWGSICRSGGVNNSSSITGRELAASSAPRRRSIRRPTATRS